MKTIRLGIIGCGGLHAEYSVAAMRGDKTAGCKVGGAPAPFPDFTNGRWMCREAEPVWPYSLVHVN